MTEKSTFPFDTWLANAREGDSDCLAHLLEAYRSYLRLLARLQLGRFLRVCVSPSDLAQESIIVAREAFGGFRGQTESEMLAWLRRVLAQRLVNAHRFHLAQRRNVNTERSLDEALEQSSCGIRAFFTSAESSPSHQAVRREQEVILADALGRLPGHYSEVIVLRHLESKSFAEIANVLEKTVPAVKSIWTRAITQLRTELEVDLG